MTSAGEPTSTKPYLLRAVYEWCVDNGYTPQISVVVDAETRVPMEHVRDGEIVLNIGPLAASRLKMGNEMIECSTRFSGTARELMIPIAAVTAIYARETGHGMSFEREQKSNEGEIASEESAKPDPKDPPRPGNKPMLRRIK
jgi:stringent starvation protein B